MTKNLFIIGGPDRAGKTTFGREVEKIYGATYVHFSEPDLSPNNPSLFSRYLETVRECPTDNLVFDRSYLCGFILERFRENNHEHIGELVELEIALSREVENIVHVGIVKRWESVAKFHLEEVQAMNLAPWAEANKMISRMKEHKFYYQEMFEFYDHITMFPSLINPNPLELLG